MHEGISISVIVPVYNTEKYLDACVASIVSQTHSVLQIILVDDGSCDSSGKICDAWANKDSRIQVIHQENAGVSAARNAGLQAASGELISFVDSDDVLPLDAYEQMLNSMKEKDLTMGRMSLMEEDGTVIAQEQPFPSGQFSIDDFIKELFQERRYCYLGFLWDKLLKRTIIQNQDIRFDPRIRLNEDRLFLLEYLLHCSSISFCDAVVYFYRQRTAGVITSTRRNQTVTDSEMTVIDSFRKMAVIAKTYSEELYYIVARKSFESALDLCSRVAREDVRKIRQIRQFKRENTRICLNDPNIGICEKIKIVGHCILER
ncbi:MAG: glycosyltransferase [Clostridiales bacterium]|nr:glycosyltransferase [Clostridiales bacterium]